MSDENISVDQQTESLWVIVRVQENSYAIPANDVYEMVQVPHVVSIPEKTHFVRGIINLRGKVMSLIDLRVRLGISSLPEEAEAFIQMLKGREEDHKKWLKELELSVEDKRAFQLETDPHKCEFGQWYENFETNNFQLKHVLKKFDKPHKIIHANSIKVIELVEYEKFEEARQLIENMKNNEFEEMESIFEEVREHNQIDTREIAVIVKDGVEMLAVSVDKVESVESLEEEDLGGIQQRQEVNDQLITAIKHRAGKQGKPILILDITKLLNHTEELKKAS